ncbi:MAG: right-handed parallel beta-helix repeat-containing protein [Planctomycetota bacterium]
MLLPSCLLVLAPAQTTWYVDAHNLGPGTGTSDDPFHTLQEAVDAPTTLSGDSIRVRDGVYRESVVIDGKEIRVIAGHGMANVVVERPDAAGAPCFTVRNVDAPGVLIAGFQFRTPSNAATSGRGINVESAQLEVSRCQFSSLSAHGSGAQGGAIHAGTGSSLELLGCSFDDCGAGSVAMGGAVSFEGDVLALEGCTFSGNQSGWKGGAVWFNGSGSFAVRRSTYTNNQTIDGGAIWMEPGAGAATIRDTEFLFNGHNGKRLSGGVHGHGSMEGCLFRRNLGQENGAVSGAWDIHTTEFDGNGGSDSGSGNGASAVHGQPRSTLTNCYVHGHTGASSLLPPSAVINADLVNCVLEGNRTAVDVSMSFTNGAGAISDCVAVDCVFRENLILSGSSSSPNPDESGRGGAAFRSLLTGCVLIGNSAAFGGAAAECELINCTLYGNSAVAEAGALWEGTMVNSIAFGNGAAPLGGGATASWSCVEFGAPGPGNLSEEPRFLLPGGGDLRVRASSPCIGAGDPAQPGPDGRPRDQGALPFDPETPQSYCASAPDAFGCRPALRSLQAPSAATPFRFEATGMLTTNAALSFLAMDAGDLPYLNGRLCIGAPFLRGPVGAITTGSSSLCDTRAEFTLTPVDLLQAGFAPGDAIYTQVIYRDPGTLLGVSITGALAAVFLP